MFCFSIICRRGMLSLSGKSSSSQRKSVHHTNEIIVRSDMEDCDANS